MKPSLTPQQAQELERKGLLGQHVDEGALPTPTSAIIYVEGADCSLHPAIAMECGGKPSDLMAWFTAQRRALGDLGGHSTQVTLISRALASLQRFMARGFGNLAAEDSVMPWSTLVRFNIDGSQSALPHLRYAIRWNHVYDVDDRYVRTCLALELL